MTMLGAGVVVTALDHQPGIRIPGTGSKFASRKGVGAVIKSVEC